MNINIKLDKNFTMQFNKLYNEFGTELAKLYGFADEQLSYTDFIDNFVDKQTVADASIDGNANVGTKDICSLESEMSKPHSKLLAFNKIYYELNKKYGFKTPDPIFEIIYREPNSFTVYLKSEKYFKNQKYLNENCLCFPTQMDALDFIQQQLEELNKTYLRNNGRIATEGVVINTTKSNGNQKYIKLKPRDIENKHRNNGGIPRSSITKEVLKYFDEYGSAVKGLYLIDENHHTEYIHRMLKEEYPEEWVNNSAKRIEKVFMQIWDAKQVPESIHDICNELIHKYGDKGITHCMRMFAQKYPMKKKDATTVYRVLEMKGIER